MKKSRQQSELEDLFLQYQTDEISNDVFGQHWKFYQLGFSNKQMHCLFDVFETLAGASGTIDEKLEALSWVQGRIQFGPLIESELEDLTQRISNKSV